METSSCATKKMTAPALLVRIARHIGACHTFAPVISANAVYSAAGKVSNPVADASVAGSAVAADAKTRWPTTAVIKINRLATSSSSFSVVSACVSASSRRRSAAS